MQILSHRGFWRDPAERNTEAAFARSFERGFGTETDIRDCLGKLVISHDPPTAAAMPFDAMLAIHQAHGPALPLALNVKADGLQSLVAEALKRFPPTGYFLFDMSVPDALGYVRAGLRVFTRQSELEPQPPFYEDAAGVWMDCFFGDWIDERDIARHLGNHKQVCLVSPDLHKRTHQPFWDRLRLMGILDNDDLMLCTDFPEEARGYFRAQD